MSAIYPPHVSNIYLQECNNWIASMTRVIVDDSDLVSSCVLGMGETYRSWGADTVCTSCMDHLSSSQIEAVPTR